uniref:RNB domain-containing protein n=1 Tax=viral metagenome TaxID=1070528 RepID=A0A6C0JIX5_9ZZZZ
MYKITFEDNLYKEWDIYETDNYTKTTLTINPLEMKLFNNDTFNINGDIIYSSLRENKYNAGVLDLSKTYGKDKNFLYLCKPDDKRVPYFLVPYNIPVSFNKIKTALYITFEFKHWNHKMPYGTMTQNLGTVDTPLHYYEYSLYCKSLNVSTREFNNDVINTLKKKIDNYDNIIDAIIDKYNIPKRTSNVFTIDSETSIDLDDGISIQDGNISVYISNVPIIIDFLNLWNSFTNRISTIYLPDKKHSMLPLKLSQLCSLNEKETRICLVMDINIKTLQYSLSTCYVNINKNYSYEESSLLTNPDYLMIKDILHAKNSHDLITELMIMFNKNCVNYMKPYQNGIYKINNGLNHKLYETYNTETTYMHITSPIRRLVDILNIYQLCTNDNQFTFSETANRFYNNWYNKLDYINKTTKNIRKTQSKCKLLSLFDKENHNVYKGQVFDKMKYNEIKYKYQVFISDINVYTTIVTENELFENNEYEFKIFIFHDESQLKHKIKLQLNDLKL